MRFWDSSAIVPLLLQEESTAQRRALLRQDPVVITWWASAVECESAITRLQRDSALSDESAQLARRRLAELSGEWRRVQPAEAILSLAIRLLRTHPLRAADAIQLAAGLQVSDGQSGLGFVCNDQRLADAARREGFAVV